MADKSVSDLVSRISDQASTLVREEIELAKAEMSIKARRLGVGAAVGAVAGFFVLLALIYAFEALAWFLNDEIFDSLWLGFVVVTGLLLVLAAIGGFVAYRSLKAGAPPTPDMAIAEAKLTRQALERPELAAPVPAPPAPPSGASVNNPQ